MPKTSTGGFLHLEGDPSHHSEATSTSRIDSHSGGEGGCLRGMCPPTTMARFPAMSPVSDLVARPGVLLRLTCSFGLLTWLGIFALLFTVPGITSGTFFGALGMASLFALLLLGQAAAEIRCDEAGLSGRTLFRRVRCRWAGVRRIEIRPFLPGLTIFLVATSSGPLVFTSLWRNHRPLLDRVRDRARLA